MRHLIAVFVPIVLWGVLWVVGNLTLVLLAPEHYADDGTTTHAGLLAGTIALSVALSLLAGFVCIRLAPGHRMTSVLTLAGLQLLIGVMVQSRVWDLMPLWYHVAFLALVVPAHLAGGWLGRGGTADPE